MRWRYLILGVMFCVPVGTAIQFWPPMPMFSLPDDQLYVGEDVAARQLVFFQCDVGYPPKSSEIRRYDADTGALVSSTPLNWPTEIGVRLGLKASYACNFIGVACDNPENQRQRGAVLFDTRTGRCLLHLPVVDVLFGPSQDGRYFAIGVEDPPRVVMTDTLTGKTTFELAAPTPECLNPKLCFSPDSRHALIQLRDVEREYSVLYLVNCETGNEEGRFDFPVLHELAEWRGNEVRSVVEGDWRMDLYRHSFDGVTLGVGVVDPLLKANYPDWEDFIQSMDGNDWVSQFIGHPKRRPLWGDLSLKVAELTGLHLIDKNQIPEYCGSVSLIGRDDQKVRFFRQLDDNEKYVFAMDGRRLIIFDSTLSFGFGLGTPTYIEIYRTDGLPRWPWTALGVVGVILQVVAFARWRHKVVVRRRAA